MAIEVRSSGRPCGAEVRSIDLSNRLSADEVTVLRAAWLDHHVLSFPGQHLSDDDLERFTLYFGPFVVDPYIEPIDGVSQSCSFIRAMSTMSRSAAACSGLVCPGCSLWHELRSQPTDRKVAGDHLRRLRVPRTDR